MNINKILEKFEEERQKAIKKHGSNWSTDPLHAVSILNEEVGELTRACVRFYYGEYEGTDEMEEEVIQVGAMAIRFLDGLKKYKTRK